MILEDYNFYKNLLYIFLATRTLFFILNKVFNVKSNNLLNHFCILTFIVGTCYISSYKEIELFSDFYQYKFEYNCISTFKDIFTFKGDYLFYFLFYLIKSFNFHFEHAVFILLLMYNSFIVLALRNVSQKNYVLLFFVLASFFFYYSMSLNILRQGIGFSFFLYGFSIYLNNKKKAYIFYLLSILLHIVYLILFLIYFVAKYIKKIKYIYMILFFSSLISILNINLLKFLPFQLEGRVSVNTEAFSEIYRTGFRIDFYLFNIFFFFIALLIYKKLKKFDEEYKIVFFSYSIASSLFFLTFQIPFSDRFGLLSWIFIPLLITPLFEKKLTINHNLPIIGIYFFSIALYIIY